MQGEKNVSSFCLVPEQELFQFSVRHAPSTGRGCEIIPERGRPARSVAAKMAALRIFSRHPTTENRPLDLDSQHLPFNGLLNTSHHPL
jgi:hypothetical protein